VANVIYGGLATAGNGAATATGNTVTVNGASVELTVSGGRAVSTQTATANNNSVTINGGFIQMDVAGGHVDSAYNAIATSNTVIISGNPTFGAGAIIYGGYNAQGSSATGDIFTGNRLALKSPGLTVGGLYNFQYLDFYLPTTFGAGDKMLIIAPGGEAQLSENSDGSGRQATVNVGIDGASTPLKAGDQVILIDASAGTLTGAPANSKATGSGMQGVTLLYEFDITTAGNQVLATVAGTASGRGPTVNPQAKSLPEGFIASVAATMQGADLAAGQGMGNAVNATRVGSAGAAPVFAGFSAMSGGSMRINSGSHVDMHSVSLMAGFAWARDFDFGRPTLGAFFEYGTGSYDTYNSFANAASVKGNGNAYYYGGGVLARMDFVDTGPGHFYAEGSFRAGRLHNDYRNGDLRDAMGRRAEYTSSSPYYGFHIGAGYTWQFSKKASLDLYSKYFWTRVEGDSVRLATGDPIKFKAVDSSRLRFGGRVTYAVNEHVSPYIGAAYEREFDGKARATTNGFDIPAPSIRGDTGIGEIGLTLTPSKNLPLSIDVGVQGYVGKRQGVTGSLQVKWTF
jgi:outer membrane autotransporter protein